MDEHKLFHRCFHLSTLPGTIPDLIPFDLSVCVNLTLLYAFTWKECMAGWLTADTLAGWLSAWLAHKVPPPRIEPRSLQ